jgi:hypothetical protein
LRFVKLFLLSLFLFSLPQWMKSDFKLPPIHSQIPSELKWESPPPSSEILKILDQPFSYFSHGNQSTVFESEDKKYVLKLFRYRRSLFPFLHQAKNWCKKKPKQDFMSKLHKTFDAAHLASSEAQAFTQVVYAHLNLTDQLLPTILLKAKKTYQIPLDKYRFVIQKKVQPFKETLLSARENPQEMNRLMQSFLDLLEKRSSLNIRNSDPNLGPNFGFLNGQAVELDFGNYQKINPDLKMKKAEIANYLLRFEHWLTANAPEYVKELHVKSTILYDQLDEAPKSLY